MSESSDMNEENKEDEQGLVKGFDGLFGLAPRKAQNEGSEGGEPPALPHLAQREPNASVARQTDQPASETAARPESRTKTSGSGKAWGIIGTLFFVIVSGVLIELSSNQSHVDYSLDAADAAAAAAAEAQAAAAEAQAAVDAAMAQPRYATAADAAAVAAAEAQAAVDAAIAQPWYATAPNETKPAVGTDLLLSEPEIRYCLFESHRVDGAQGHVNLSDQASIDFFNKMVDDFNVRCASYRYHTSEFAAIQREARVKQSSLRLEGSERIRLANAAAGRSTPSDSGLGISSPAANAAPQVFSANAAADAAAAAAAVAAAAEDAVARRGLETPLSQPEKDSLESACSTDKYTRGPAAYRACLAKHEAALASGVRRPSLATLSSTEKQSIESACSTDKYVNGPAAYNLCLVNQLAAMSGQGSSRPDLSSLSHPERQSIESVCSTEKYVRGPSAYNKCLTSQLAAMSSQGSSRPDLSGLSHPERQFIESACSTDKYVRGPSSYNKCLRSQLSAMAN